jgi:hypothetical protein
MTAIIEIYVAVIGACLPIMVPVYNKLRYNDPFHKSTSTKGRTTAANKTIDNPFGRHHMGDGAFERLENQEHFETAVHGPKYGPNPAPWNRTSSSHTDSDIPLEGITVKRDVIWSKEHRSEM